MNIFSRVHEQQDSRWINGESQSETMNLFFSFAVYLPVLCLAPYLNLFWRKKCEKAVKPGELFARAIN